MNVFLSKQKKSQLDKLIEENDELKNTLHTVLQKHQSLIELDNKLNDARTNLADTLKEVESNKNELQSITEEIGYKSEYINELNNQKVALEEKLAALKANNSETAALEKEYSEKQKKLNELNGKFFELENSYSRLTAERDEVEQTVEELKLKEEKILQLVNKFGGDVDVSVDKLKESESELNNNIAVLKSEETRRNSILKSLDEKISLNEEIKSSLEASLAALVGQLAEKEKMFEEFTSRRDSIVEELHIKQKEFNEFDLKYNFEKDTLQKLETGIKDLSDKKKNLIDEVSKFEAIKNEIQDKILLLKKEEEETSEELSRKHNLIDEIEKRKFQFEEEYLKIEKDFSTLVENFTEEFEEGKKRINAIRLEILEKEKELNLKEKTLLEKTSQVAEYGGLAKVLQKERSATEQLLINLKEEYEDLTKDILTLKDESNKHKISIQQLRSEIESLDIKKESLEKEIRQLIAKSGEDYSILNEQKQNLALEINENDRLLENLKDQVAKFKDDLRSLKAETASTETRKEEFTARISELIAMEKSLRYKISEHEKRLSDIEGNS